MFEIQFPQLPYYLTIRVMVDHDTDTVRVEVHSTIHKNQVVEIPTEWSTDFVRERNKVFRSDVFGFVVRQYGLKRQPVQYM